MKPSSSFKMSKQSKRTLALLPFADTDVKSAYKHMIIEAEIAASVKPKVQKSRDVNNMPINDAV